MLNLKFAEIHTPLFHQGVNLGLKLDVAKRSGLKLQYDEKKEFLLVWLGNQVSLVPRETVVNMIPLELKDTGYIEPKGQTAIEKPQATTTANPKVVAQVSTPQSHVFSPMPGLVK